MIKPYIGITDFTTRGQTQAILDVLRRVGGDNPVRNLGVGIMMTRKTLNDIPSRFTDVFPKKESVADIFVDDPLACNVLHYADYEEIDVFNNLMKVVKWGGPNLQAIQLDMIWPNPKVIKRFRNQYPEIQIIIQVNLIALNQVEQDGRKLVAKLHEYGDSIDYVLLDMSMGEGKPMDWHFLTPYITYIYSILSYLGLVVAGGLGPNTLELVEPLIKVFNFEISIDAEGKLRPSGSYLDPIHWPMAEEYLVKSVKMFEGIER